MASHVQGIAITIKAFLPTGKTLDEQFTALSIVKDAHASGDYSKVLAAAKIDEVKAEQKTRRIEDAVPAPADEPSETSGDASGLSFEGCYAETDATGGVQIVGDDDPTDDGVPEFIKASRKRA